MRIEEYLDELACQLGVGPTRRRRILREIEAHLQDAAHQEEGRGYGREEAERRAVERLGGPEEIAGRFGDVPDRSRTSLVVVTALVVAATCAVVSLGVTLGLRAGNRTARSAVPSPRAAEVAYARRVSLVRERLEAANIARTVCGGKHANRICVAEAVKNLFRDRAFRPCAKDPGLVYAGHGTWRTPGYSRGRVAPAPGGGWYISECS